MPMINLRCSKKISLNVLDDLSKLIAEGIGKPERYVMVVANEADLMMSGSAGNAAYAEVKSLGGLTGSVNKELSATICSLLEERLEIPKERIYITFQSLERDHWGWNGSTFG